MLCHALICMAFGMLYFVFFSWSFCGFCWLDGSCVMICYGCVLLCCPLSACQAWASVSGSCFPCSFCSSCRIGLHGSELFCLLSGCGLLDGFYQAVFAADLLLGCLFCCSEFWLLCALAMGACCSSFLGFKDRFILFVREPALLFR